MSKRAKITENKFTKCKRLMDLGVKPSMVSRIEGVSMGTAYGMSKADTLTEMREQQREYQAKKTKERNEKKEVYNTAFKEIDKNESMTVFERQVIDGLNTVIVQLRAIASA